VDQEHAVAGLTNLNDLDNPSNASAEQSCDEAAETKNVLETTNTQAEKSEETQPDPEIPNSKPPNPKCKYQ